MILILAYDLDRKGGIERLSRQVNNCLIKEGVDIRLLTTKRLFRGWIGKQISRLYFILRLVLLIPQSKSVMVMHVLLLKPLEWATWITKAKYKKICWTYGIDVWGSAFRQHQKRLSSCDHIITISSFGYQKLQSLGCKLSIIHPMADLISPSTKPEDIPSDFRLLTVARMSKQEGYKGHRDVLKAISMLKRENKLPVNFQWDIVGEGDEKQALIDYAEQLGVRNEVQFHGEVTDHLLEQIYAHCSIFIMPSNYGIREDGSAMGEGFGIVYVEAALAGRPSIAARSGGQTDIVIDGYTGWLVDSNSEKIAELLETLINDRVEIKIKGANARKHALSKFSYKRFATNMLKVIED